MAYLSSCFGEALHEIPILEAVKNRRKYFLFVDLAHKLFDNGLMLLLKKFFQFFACTACPCKSSSDQLRDSDVIGVKVPRLAISSQFPEAFVKRRNSYDPIYVGVLLLVLSSRKLSCEQFCCPFSLTTLTTHSSSIDWYVLTAWTLSVKIRFCVADK